MFGTNTFSQVPFSAAPGLLYSASLADTATALMVASAIATFTTSLSEAASAADSSAASFSVMATVAESSTAGDALRSSASFPVQLFEAVATQDQVIASAAFQASLSESITAQDLDYAAAQTFIASVSEGAFGLDSLLGRELWEQIDDTQVAGWTDILVPTTIEDIAVFGGANFGVLSFAGNSTQRYDPNPVFWKQVDDTQDTVWTDIVAV